eukprot:TRINITY_DN11608_c0_g3_i1.p1 TRINITY_DN11608_c0_g3~~TRINITY_DN11608_c0_g3_i1.p1  ORF type:complete len:915 (+),score=121.23 TRINITY_DN11608_c0_g3_i1:172-2916(+)
MHSHLGASSAEHRAASRDADGRYTRIGYVLRRCGFERHCGVVSKICLARGGRRGEATTAVTASRDGTLKCWDFPATRETETHGGASSSTTPAAAPRLRCSLEEHTGWVNDAVVLPLVSSSAASEGESRRVISASNDNLIKIWNVDPERHAVGVSGALLSLRYHSDYVTCLTFAPSVSLLASAGLDSRVVVSDLEAATRILTLQPAEESEPYGNSVRRNNAAAQHRSAGQYVPLVLAPMRNKDPSNGSTGGGASVWSLATTRSASLLVSGAASAALRLWDPRTGSQLWRLRGHTDNIRSVVLSEDGSICISASADRTVRVWDIGMRRCVHVFEEHVDSVWSLAVPGNSCGHTGPSIPGGGAGGTMNRIFSGGRDGMILSYDIRRLQATLAVEEPRAIQGLAVSVDGNDIWASTDDSHIRIHTSMNAPVAQAGIVNGERVAPTATDENIVIPGTPRLTDYRVLHNKRQILVRDVCNKHALWDVTNGQCLDLPTIDSELPGSGSGVNARLDDDFMKKALSLVDKKISVPNWFSCDLTLGCLSVYLDMSQCFKADSEDVDIVLPSDLAAAKVAETPDGLSSSLPVNLGTKTLRTLFDTWVRGPGSIGRIAGERGGNGSNDSFAMGITSVAAAAGVRLDAANAFGQGSNYGSSYRGIAALTQQEEPPAKSEWDEDQILGMPADQAGGPVERFGGGRSSASHFPPATRLLLVSRGSNRPSAYRGRLFCGLLNGSEAPELLPSWAVDVVWKQKAPPEELCGERTMLFSLVKHTQCSPELALPPLQTPYYMAGPRMRVRQIMEYLIQALDFDWSTPPSKGAARRPSSAASFVSRFGRCCVAPSSGRGRAASGDSWSSQSDGYETTGSPSGNEVGNIEGRAAIVVVIAAVLVATRQLPTTVAQIAALVVVPSDCVVAKMRRAW